MYIFLLALILTVLKWLGVPYLREASWFFIFIPYLLAIIWWSVIVPILGYDKKKLLEQKAERERKLLRERRELLGFYDDEPPNKKAHRAPPRPSRRR